MKLPTDAEKSIGVAIIQGEMGLSENHFENGWIHQWICWCPILSQTHMGMGIPVIGIWDMGSICKAYRTHKKGYMPI
jgi:hypothetical protein